jgi:flavin reductase (DIM6/NTAB) family NADH-FMN oxidoreductase RutF
MKPLKKLLEHLNGHHYRQDYLCFALEAFSHPFQLSLVQQRVVIKDITDSHAFVGYCPVIIALPAFDEISNSTEVETVFSAERLAAGEKYSARQVLASLTLKRIETIKTKDGEIFYYKAIRGEHRFTSGFHQFIGQLHNRLYNNRPGNVFLKGNLNKQVQIAYALPRKISLITVRENNQYNLFPTDLHGQVDENYYIISLRHAGKACEQVLQARKIALSDMRATAYKQVYRLGKNHMQPLKEFRAFDFSPVLSPQFGLPLPNAAIACKELQLEDSVVVGIHRLLLFKILSNERLTATPQTLVHIHNAYASWRHKKALEGNYLLR